MSDNSSSPPLLSPGPEPADLEADLAYFDARLALLTSLPDSLYQRAQQRTYSALEESLQDALAGLRRQVEQNKRTS